MKYKRIFLVGFRTTGKTTIGKILAEKIDWSFLDMDFLITEQAGKDVDLLTKSGSDWLEFRQIENEVLGEVSKMDNVVISCGGGVGVNNIIDESSDKTFGELNRQILDNSKDSIVILLTSSEEKIKERLLRKFKNKKIMPFLNSEIAKNSDNLSSEDLIKTQVDDSIKSYKERKPLYESLTNIQINSDNLTIEQTAQEIINYAK